LKKLDASFRFPEGDIVMRKSLRFTACLWGFGFGVLLSLCCSATAQQATGQPNGNQGASVNTPTAFWVAPDGSDDNDGSQSRPLRTLERARDKARQAGGPAGGGITVYLSDGVYRLDHTLVLDGTDSGLSFKAAPGAHPVISGAVRVTGWSLHDATRNIYKAKVGHLSSRQFYVNGRRAMRAHTDDNPPGFTPSPILPPAGSNPYVITGSIQYTPPPGDAGQSDPAKWQRVKSIEAVLLTQWKMMSVPLDHIEQGNPTKIFLQQPGWTNANVFFDSKTQKPGIWGFWQVTRFENAYEFLRDPGDWYLNEEEGWIYYIPRPGEDMTTADAELPVLETLVAGDGASDLRFEGLTFAYATWNGPSSGDGYVDDQSGFHLVGNGHRPNVTGHDQDVVRTPGNLSFNHGRRIVFTNDAFEHLGAAALDFAENNRDNTIDRNRFDDISAAAIQLGEVSRGQDGDDRPGDCATSPAWMTCGNRITNNLITRTGRDYVDSAAIIAGFTRNTLISHNTINDVPWAGISMGWGWGLLDPGMYPGIPGATSGQWGTYTTPTQNSGNRIANNLIGNFLNVLWDGGAIYTTGRQGLSLDDALQIEGNVAFGRGLGGSERGRGGGNIFYTDGGSRYVKVKGNASFDNPIGNVNLPGIPLANAFKYGSDFGGCRTYGDIDFEGNYWLEGGIPAQELWTDVVDDSLIWIISKGSVSEKFFPYTPEGFFDVCPYTDQGVTYPTRLQYQNNHNISAKSAIPPSILQNAGVQP
jgi:hypothetical protein